MNEREMTPRQQLYEALKGTLFGHGLASWNRIKDVPAEEIYRTRRADKPELTDEEFIQDWLNNRSRAHGAFEVGVAWGRVLESEKTQGINT